MANKPTTELDQAKMGAAAVGVVIAQALHESDPSLLERLEKLAEKLYRELEDRGDDGAAEVLLYFGRALVDQKLFPR